jgi:hypothetical protein
MSQKSDDFETSPSKGSLRSMKSEALVSILLNNFNYGRFLGEAIESALAQTYPNVEVIVVDDGSTDNSREVIACYADRVKVVAKENGGQASAFNSGFAASHGEIVFFLDSDDIFLSNKVSQIAEVYEMNPEIGWCFDTPEWFDSTTCTELPSPKGEKHGLWDARKTLELGINPHIPTATSGLSFRREQLSRILPMPEIIRITSDNYIKLAALASTVGWIDPRKVSLQRIHGHNAYTNKTNGKKRLVGLTEMLTGFCLQKEFSSLRKVAFKMFCRGLGTLWATGGVEEDLSRLARTHLRSMKGLRRAEAWARVLYWGARLKVSG